MGDLEDLFSSSDDSDDDSSDEVFHGFTKSNMVKIDRSILISLSSESASESDSENFRIKKHQKSSPKKKIENLKINLKDIKRKRKVDIKIKSPSPKKQRISMRIPKKTYKTKKTSPVKQLTERQKQHKARQMAREVKSTD